MADDIKITDNRILLENGDFGLVRNENRIIQQIYMGLRILVADWVLDVGEGINYLGGLRAYPEILSAQIKYAINSVEGVDTVLKYNFFIDKDNVYNVQATVKVGNSEIAVNDKINPNMLGVTK